MVQARRESSAGQLAGGRSRNVEGPWFGVGAEQRERCCGARGAVGRARLWQRHGLWGPQLVSATCVRSVAAVLGRRHALRLTVSGRGSVWVGKNAARDHGGDGRQGPVQHRLGGTCVHGERDRKRGRRGRGQVRGQRRLGVACVAAVSCRSSC